MTNPLDGECEKYPTKAWWTTDAYWLILNALIDFRLTSDFVSSDIVFCTPVPTLFSVTFIDCWRSTLVRDIVSYC